MRCLNCDATLAPGEAFCRVCGQKAATRRLTLHQIGDDLVHALVHLDRSVLSLIGQLVVRPGRVAQEYVSGRRKRYFGPFAFVVIVVGLATATMALSGFGAFSSETPNPVAEFLQRHVNVVILLQVPVLAAFCALLFRKQGLYFAEHLVLAAYTSGMRSLLLTGFLVPLWTWWHPAMIFFALYLCVWLAYFGFAASQFYGGACLGAWLKGALAAALAHATLQGAVSLWTWLAVD